MIDVIRELEDFGVVVDVCDPWVDPNEARAEFGIEMRPEPDSGAYDAIVLAVAHAEFRDAGAAVLRTFGRDGHVFYDLKHAVPASASDLRL